METVEPVDSGPPEGSVPTSCTVGVVVDCSCSDGTVGTQQCLASAAFGSCSCETHAPPAGTNLIGCFTKDDGFDTCDAYCESQGRTCRAESCGADGTLTGQGYTWVSWPALEASACEALSEPSQMSFDACTTPIWLQPSKPRDDLVRCCCE